MIIPDNFRIVRHFVNLLKYHGVEQLPLIGNYEWRSKSLLEPWDSFLQGAAFVDFVGSYDKLPKGFGEQYPDSPFFVAPDLAGQLDFRLIGYHTGRLALRVPIKPGSRKKDLVHALYGLKNTESPNVAQNVFNESRSSSWPTYHFTVADRTLVQKNLTPSSQSVNH